MKKEFDEEELLKEYEWAEKHIPDDVIPKPAPDEFERIWRRIQEERGKWVKGGYQDVTGPAVFDTFNDIDSLNTYENTCFLWYSSDTTFHFLPCKTGILGALCS